MKIEHVKRERNNFYLDNYGFYNMLSFSSWTFIMCFYKLYFLGNQLLQILQVLSFFWLWTHKMCVFKSFDWTKLFWQISHLNSSFFHDQFQCTIRIAIDVITKVTFEIFDQGFPGKYHSWILFSFMNNFNVPFKLQKI